MHKEFNKYSKVFLFSVNVAHALFTEVHSKTAFIEIINTVTGFLKKNFTTFLGKTKTYTRRRYVGQYFF